MAILIIRIYRFASNLVQRGVSIYVVKELVGHENIKTTQIYSQFTKGKSVTGSEFTLIRKAGF